MKNSDKNKVDKKTKETNQKMNSTDEEVEVEVSEDAEECEVTEECEVLEDSKKYDELLDKFQRSMAEYDNFRKRTIKEKATIFDDGVRDTIEKFIPIIDTFQRAVDTSEKNDDSFYTGMEMILRQFMNALNEIGIEEIASVGESFDHNLHFAVSHVEDDEHGENEVVEELQKGYIYKDKVIRHSMVKVAN